MLSALAEHDRRLYLVLLANFSFMGGVVTVFAAAISEVFRTYGWSYTDAGFVLSASSVGFFVASLVAGVLVDRLGARPVVVTGLLLEVASLMFFGRTPSVALNVVLNFCIGLGLGANEMVTNLTVVRIENDGRSRLMNLIHAAWCIGAVVGPLGVADLIRTGVSWQVIFPTVGAAVALMTVGLAFQRFPSIERGDRTGAAAADRSEAGGRSRRGRYADGEAHAGAGAIIVLSALAIFVYLGVEKGVYSWVSVFFVRVLGTSASVGAAMVALYWTGQCAGRLGLSIVYRGSRQELVLAVLCGMTVVTLGVLVASRVMWLSAVLTFVAGLANSGIFPLIVSLAGKFSARGRAVGLVTGAGGFAGFVFPFLVAGVSDRWGIAAGFSTVAVIGVMLFVLVMIVVARVRASGVPEMERPAHSRPVAAKTQHNVSGTAG